MAKEEDEVTISQNHYYNPYQFSWPQAKRVTKTVTEREFDTEGNMLKETVTVYEEPYYATQQPYVTYSQGNLATDDKNLNTIISDNTGRGTA